MKKDEFKEFARKNPSLINFVNNGDMTWQKFYEMYDLYGEDESVWDPYIKNSNVLNKDNFETNLIKSSLSGVTLSEIIKFFKNIDLDSLQEGIGNVQRVLGLVQDFSKKNNNEDKSNYKPRPLYKHFDD